MSRLIGLYLAFWAVATLWSATASLDEAEPRLSEEKVENGAIFWVDNPLGCPITATLTATLDNTVAEQPAPLTAVIPPGPHQRLVAIHRVDEGRAWHYQCDWHWMPGDKNAKPDPDAIYALPYPKGETHLVSQGYNGRFSHTGMWRYSIDWSMPVGSSVCAARAGKIVAIKMDSDEGGVDRAQYESKANYIEILHADGTLGSYMHLQKNGALVVVGQEVQSGQFIGYSGNTGFSSRPHLHFHVGVPVDGTTFQSLPVQFYTGHRSEAPREGELYTAVATP